MYAICQFQNLGRTYQSSWWLLFLHGTFPNTKRQRTGKILFIQVFLHLLRLSTMAQNCLFLNFQQRMLYHQPLWKITMLTLRLTLSVPAKILIFRIKMNWMIWLETWVLQKQKQRYFLLVSRNGICLLLCARFSSQEKDMWSLQISMQCPLILIILHFVIVLIYRAYFKRLVLPAQLRIGVYSLTILSKAWKQSFCIMVMCIHPFQWHILFRWGKIVNP